MAKNKKHIRKGDITAIIISFGFAVFNLFTSYLAFALFYLSIALLRSFALIYQTIIVREDDDPQKKFKKERILSRFVGIFLMVLDVFYSGVLILFLTKQPSQFFLEHSWAASFYIAYAAYKFIIGFIHLKKARRSWSPYREIICVLTFFDAMITVLNSFTLMGSAYMVESASTAMLGAIAVAVTVIVFIMSIKMIKSRRVPNLLK